MKKEQKRDRKKERAIRKCNKKIAFFDNHQKGTKTRQNKKRYLFLNATKNSFFFILIMKKEQNKRDLFVNVTKK